MKLKQDKRSGEIQGVYEIDSPKGILLGCILGLGVLFLSFLLVAYLESRFTSVPIGIIIVGILVGAGVVSLIIYFTKIRK